MFRGLALFRIYGGLRVSGRGLLTFSRPTVDVISLVIRTLYYGKYVSYHG